MIELLVTLLIICIVIAVFYYIITLIPLPPPFHLIVRAVLALIFLFWVLGVFGMGYGGPAWHVHFAHY